MAETQKKLSLILKAKDRLSSVLMGVDKKSDRLWKKMSQGAKRASDAFNKIGRSATIAGGALLGISTLNIKAAADFEKGMSNVSTLVDTNKESMKQMKKEVLDIAQKSPVALETLTGALYSIRSAGIDAGDAMSVLENSAKLGVAGLGTTEESVDLVTSAINAFNLKGKEQLKLYDTIFKTVKYGKTTISGIAQGFGGVAGAIAGAGIKIDDYLASVAALTTSGMSAAKAHTQLKAAVSKLTKASKPQQKIFRQLGVKDFNTLVKKSGGMVGAFKQLYRATNGNRTQLIKLVGSVEAYNAILSLTGEQNKVYNKTLNDMRNGSDEVSKAYKKQSSTLDFQVNRMKNVIEDLRIMMGDDLAPAFGKVVNGLSALSDTLGQMPSSLRKVISIGGALTGLALVGFGTLTLAIGGTIKAITDFITYYRMIRKFLKTSALIARIGNAFKTVGTAIRMIGPALGAIGEAVAGIGVGPILAIIAGLTAGAILIVKYWHPIAALFKGIGEGLKQSLAPTIQHVLSVLQRMGGNIKQSLAPAIQALSPVFQKLGAVLAPVGKWFRSLFTPINTTGKASYNLGVQIGRLIGGFAKFTVKAALWVTGITPMYKMLKNIGKAAKWAGDKVSGVHFGKGDDKVSGKGAKVDGSHANGLANVPFNGYIAELHKGERVLTANENRNLIRTGTPSGGSINVTFAPVIHADANTDTKTIENIVREQCSRFIAQIQSVQNRRMAGAYAV